MRLSNPRIKNKPGVNLPSLMENVKPVIPKLHIRPYTKKISQDEYMSFIDPINDDKLVKKPPKKKTAFDEVVLQKELEPEFFSKNIKCDKCDKLCKTFNRIKRHINISQLESQQVHNFCSKQCKVAWCHDQYNGRRFQWMKDQK